MRLRFAVLNIMVSLHWKHFGWNKDTGFPEDTTVAELHLKELLA